jgi:ABC-type uncharacterized transport system substrate-binding protein
MLLRPWCESELELFWCSKRRCLLLSGNGSSNLRWHRLPTMFGTSNYVERGGLMSYGPNLTEQYRRAAIYVDKILRGAKPADLPVEQAMRFELFINLKTAKQIGLTVPPNVLARADKVVR